MLNKIIHFSIKNKLAIGLMVLALIVWGIYSLKQLPIDAVPDITNNQVQIITQSPSNGAEDIERFVTFPIEQTMAKVTNRSISSAPLLGDWVMICTWLSVMSGTASIGNCFKE